jgi:predicted nuclease with TOPRIM domain
MVPVVPVVVEVPRCVWNGSKSLGVKALKDCYVGNRNKYEELQQELKYMKQWAGLAVAALECKVDQLQDELYSSLKQQVQLCQEMKQLKEHLEMQQASSELHPTSRELGSTFR